MLSLNVNFNTTTYFKGKLDKCHPTRRIITFQQLMRVIFQHIYIMRKSFTQINTYDKYIHRVIKT